MFTPLKLVISGPTGAGKTTFIQSVSEIPVVNTDEISSEDIGKPLTTVALDFGLMRVEDYELHLYGTPGQERFNYMWDVLCEGALGLVVLLAGDKPGDFPAARRIFDHVTTQIPIPVVIGVTRQDMGRVWQPEDVADFFEIDPGLVLGLDARERNGCIDVLQRLFEVIDASQRQEAVAV